MSDLITVPSFIFSQSDDDNIENPIWVQYWNGIVCLKQEGQEINILPEKLSELFREIKKNLPEAERALKAKN